MRCLASALHTAENMLVPACLAVYLQFSGGRAEAVAQYGSLKGMALPLLTFPFGLLGSLSVLLMPEITATQTALEAWQIANNITPLGVVDDSVWKQLKADALS